MRHGVLVGSKKIKREMSTVATNPRQLQQYSGQWNVEVVRNKVTTRCFWTACKAFTVGLLLLIIGTSMAVVGYYAEQLSEQSQQKGNSTVKIKNESRGYHLNNLSYAGPIVMGIGGFIVVAACVMTFEARDSAAKVVPAKFKPGSESSVKISKKPTSHSMRSSQVMESKRSAGSQTPGSKVSGSFKIGSGSGYSPINDLGGRRAMTTAFFQFSQALMEHSSFENDRRGGRKSVSDVALNKSPSAPNLGIDPRSANKHHHHHDEGRTEGRRKASKASPRSQRGSARPLDGGNSLLNPHLLQRQALSMDSPFYDGYGCCNSPQLSRQTSGRSGGSRESLDKRLGASAGGSGSQASMALDLHDCQVTLTVKDETQTKRSDTARRHQLLRQKPVEDEKDDKVNRCSCIPKMLCAHTVDDSAIKTFSRTKTRGPRYQSLKSNRGQDFTSKNLTSYRQRSFSHSRSYTEDKERRLPHFRDLEGKIYCIEDQKNRFPSWEKIKRTSDEKPPFDRRLSMQNRWSPERSPHGTLVKNSECRVHQQHGSSECMVHGNRDPAVVNHALVRKNAKRRKSTQKMESSLSVDESRISRSYSRSPTDRGRMSRSPTQISPSVSPTRKGNKSASVSPNHSCQGVSSRKGSPVRFMEEIQVIEDSILPCDDEQSGENDEICQDTAEEPS